VLPLGRSQGRAESPSMWPPMSFSPVLSYKYVPITTLDQSKADSQIVAWVIFIAFLFVAVYRSYQYSKYPHLRDSKYNAMRYLLWTLTAVTLLIFWRACYRTAESATGYIGGALSREDLFGTNDYLPVCLAVIIFTIAPPFRFTEYAAAQGVKDSPVMTENQLPEGDLTGEKPRGSV
jgi:hypothetical protein